MSVNNWVRSFRMLRVCAATLAILSLIAIAAPADAAIINVSVDGTDFTLDSSSDGEMTGHGRGRYNWNGSRRLSDDLEFEWNVDFDPDPFIVLATSLTNLTAAPVSISATITDATIVDFPAAGADMNANSILTLVNLDTATSATLSALSGTSVFTGLIDGNDEVTLFDDPYTLTVASGNVVNDDSAAIPGGSTSSQNMTTSIGIRHEFTVSGGSSGTANSRFEVVPEPTSAVLGLLSLLAVGIIRRR